MQLSHVLIAGTLLAFTTVVYGQKIELDIDKAEWTTDQIALMQQAANIVYKRMPSTTVAKCAFRHSWRGKPSEDDWAKKMGTMRRGQGLNIKIIRGTTRDSALGQAKVGNARANRHNVGFKNLVIRLNDSHVNYRYFDKRMNRHKDELRQRYMQQEFWADVIAHELAHTLNLTHGKSKDWKEAYQGYFITELGACVKNNGRFGTYKKY